MRVMGRPVSRQASTKEVNASPLGPVLSFPEYFSTCSSGNNSEGSPPSFNSRQRETPFTNPLSIRRVFTLLNWIRRWRHSMRSNPLCSRSSDDQLVSSSSSSRVRHSAVEKNWLNELEICAIEAASQSKSPSLIAMEKAHVSASPWG